MLAVIDTNVLVSAAINRKGPPAMVVAMVRGGEIVPVVSPTILAEYSEVLHRSKFGFAREWVDELLEDMAGLGRWLQPPPMDRSALPDPGDAPFIAAALHAGCPVVTGNARHFPPDCGVTVLSPAQCLAQLTA